MQVVMRVSIGTKEELCHLSAIKSSHHTVCNVQKYQQKGAPVVMAAPVDSCSWIADERTRGRLLSATW